MNHTKSADFDVEKHKKTHINYLEVVINEEGTVEYAIPSHQEKLIKVACEKLGATRQQLNEMCPQEYYCNFMRWLCKVTGCCSVWNEFVIGYEFTAKQIEALKSLKTHGVYKGDIPEVSSSNTNSKHYFDKNGTEIRAGMRLRMADGSVEQIYATANTDGTEDLGINASNDAYLRRHPNADREFYSLSAVDIRNAEIINQNQNA